MYFVLLLPSFQAKAQFDTVNYDKEKFLIGTLGDFVIGYRRTFIPLNGERNDWIPVNNKDLKFALFIDSLVGNDYPDLRILHYGDSQQVTLHSRFLLHTADPYFSYTPIPPSNIHEYKGTFQKNRFTTSKDKLSFLLGAYLIHGMTEEHATNRYQYYQKRNSVPVRNTDKMHGFYFIHSEDKARLCVDLLNDLGCKNVQYGIIKNTIPNAHMVFFKPNSRVRKMIVESVRLRETIERIPTEPLTLVQEGNQFTRKKF